MPLIISDAETVPSLVNVPVTPPTFAPDLILLADKLLTALIVIFEAIYWFAVDNVCFVADGETVTDPEYVAIVPEINYPFTYAVLPLKISASIAVASLLLYEITPVFRFYF